MPNAFAFLMLAFWPLVTVIMFRRLPVTLAFIWSMLLGYLLLPPLPAAFDFPMMPPLHKENIPALAVLLTILATQKAPISLIPTAPLARVLMVIFVLSPIFTVMNNGEFLNWGVVWLPGLGLSDALALTINQFLFLMPFLLARTLLATGDGQRALVFALMFGGLIYSLPVLLEVRLSPQLNTWVYGFFSGDFSQTVRFGGWRPVVFLNHGLWLAFFMMSTVIAALAVFKYDTSKWRIYWAGAFLYLAAVLVLCKSFGSLLFALFLVPVVLLFGVRFQIKVAALVALLAVAYPVLKGSEILPSDSILETVEQFDEERAGSLGFRFYNEDILLERAYEKPLFGWGSWGRNHIWNPYSGALETVTDGRWIITIGVYGWVGFLAEFGLIVLPIFLLWQQMLIRGAEAYSPFVGPLSLLLAINAIDMIPNATITPLTWMLSGALLGYVEAPKRRMGRLGPTTELKWRPLMQ